MSINSNKEEGVRGEVTQLRRIADTLDKILRPVSYTHLTLPPTPYV